MKRIEKILILIVYTFGLFAIVGLIAIFSNNGPSFNEYSEKSSDNNIAVITQVLEQRQSAKELSSDYEKSSYNVHFFVKKISSNDVTDLYVYIAAETESGIRYVQTTSAKDLEGSTTVSSTIKLTNDSSSNKFAVNEIIVEDENVTHLNKIPKTFYVKVAYNEVVNKVSTPRELNFKVDYEKAKDSDDFSSYEKRNLNDRFVDVKSDYLSLGFAKTAYSKSDSVKVAYSEYKLTNVKKIKANLPTNVAISKIQVKVTAEITNTDLVNSKYFSKYVRFFDYSGILGADISNLRTVKLSDEYKVEKIYVEQIVTLENGEVQTSRYYIAAAELAE